MEVWMKVAKELEGRAAWLIAPDLIWVVQDVVLG